MDNEFFGNDYFQTRRFARDVSWLHMSVNYMALVEDEFVLLRGLYDNPMLHNICDGLIISNETSIALGLNLGDRIRFRLNSNAITQRYNGIMVNEEFYYPTVIEKMPRQAKVFSFQP